jgi:nascent polypeptide-associated complex subunit alpha
MNAQAHLSAAQQLAPSGAFGTTASKAAVAADDEVPTLEPVEEEGEVDETGVDPKDIELVMTQVNCSRAKAVRVLKESGGDLINASKMKLLTNLSHLTYQCRIPVMAASE